MAIVADITSPASNQRVGQTVCVTGWYSGADGTPFVITCQMLNPDIAFDKTLVATIDTEEGTWQATFTGLPESEGENRGSYEIHAYANGVAVIGNPIAGVEVTAVAEVDVDIPGDLVLLRPNSPESLFVVGGTYRPGYGLANGYVVNVYLTLGGVRVGGNGRLHKMQDGRWEYRLCVRPRRIQADIHVELWHVNEHDPNRLPLVLVTKQHRLHAPDDDT